MTASLRALLSGAIDYAGLFPPAELPLEQALANYRSYCQSPDAWMLGRFVLPAARLRELPAFADPHEASTPLRLAVIGRSGETQQAFAENLPKDLQDLQFAKEALAGQVKPESLEWKVPVKGGVGPKADSFLDLTSATCLALAQKGLDDLAFYFELPAPGPQSQKILEGIFAELPFDPRLPERLGHRQPALKLRCGGLNAAAFPSAAQIAFVIDVCCRARFPLKLTAGLHHPLPRHDPALGVTMHGFVNVFVAAAVAFDAHPPIDLLTQILTETRPEAFSFSDTELRWRDRAVRVGAVAAARHRLLISFGSCSFDEPREDLRALGWL